MSSKMKYTVLYNRNDNEPKRTRFAFLPKTKEREQLLSDKGFNTKIISRNDFNYDLEEHQTR